MKPVTNYVTTYRRLFQGILDGKDPRVAYQPMAKWVADNPPFPSRAYREWITWMYKENGSSPAACGCAAAAST
jgi:polyhydroxyalkanoate synthase